MAKLPYSDKYFIAKSLSKQQIFLLPLSRGIQKCHWLWVDINEAFYREPLGPFDID